VLVAQARRSVLIIGVNLEGALVCAAKLATLARSGGTVRLLAMDPDGSALRRDPGHAYIEQQMCIKIGENGPSSTPPHQPSQHDPEPIGTSNQCQVSPSLEPRYCGPSSSHGSPTPLKASHLFETEQPWRAMAADRVVATDPE